MVEALSSLPDPSSLPSTNKTCTTHPPEISELSSKSLQEILSQVRSPPSPSQELKDLLKEGREERKSNIHRHGRRMTKSKLQILSRRASEKNSDIGSNVSTRDESNTNAGVVEGEKEEEGGDVVLNSLLRGKAAVSRAEEHIKMFEQYLAECQDYIEEGETEEVNAKEDEDEANHECKDESHIDIVDDSFVSSTYPKMNMTTSSWMEEAIKTPKEIKAEEVERRIQRDLFIEQSRREEQLELVSKKEILKQMQAHQEAEEGESSRHYHHREGNKSNCPSASNNNRPKSRKGGFNPDKLLVIRRAERKAYKAAKEKERADKEALEKANFKARPLPGGVFVKNNPLAMTQAALTKCSTPMGRKKNEAVRIDASMLLNDSTTHDHSLPSSPMVKSPSFTISAARKRAEEERRKQMEINQGPTKQIYDVISDIVGKNYVDDNENMNSSDDDSSVSSSDDDSSEQDASGLRQRIAILQASLHSKRMHCMKTIDAINNGRNAVCRIDVEDLLNDNDTMFQSMEPLHSHDDSNVSAEHSQEDDDGEVHSIVSDCNPKFNGEDSQNRKSTSLYKRHQSWLKMRDKRLIEAKAQQELEAQRFITGKPDLHNASKSWERAKAEHEEVTQLMHKKEKALQEEKNRKERMFQERHLREMKEMKDIAKSRKQELKNKVSTSCTNSEKGQINDADKVPKAETSSSQEKMKGGKEDEGCKPHDNQQEDVSSIVVSQNNSEENKESALPSSTDTGKIEQSGPESGGDTNEEDTEHHQGDMDISFADMNDDEFARMIQKYEVRTKRIRKTPSSSVSNEKKQGIEAIYSAGGSKKQKHRRKASKGAKAKSAPMKAKGLYGSIPEEIGGIYGNRFSSSMAQEKLMAELTRSDLPDMMKTDALLSKSLNHLYETSEISKPTGNESKGFVPKETKGMDNSSLQYAMIPDMSQIQREEPYERYEAGRTTFFDKSSSDEKGRFRVRDARSFDLDSMRRKPNRDDGTDDGVMFLVGKRSNSGIEGVITVLFDRSKFNEEDASKWWDLNRDRLI